MSKSVFSALITALLIALLVWLSAYLKLPFWFCLLGCALSFSASQENILGLVVTLFTALAGILFGMIYLNVQPMIPAFPYQREVVIGLFAFILYLFTHIQYFRYFACSLITFVLIILQQGNWMILCQAIVIGILFGFVAKMLGQMITGRKIE